MIAIPLGIRHFWPEATTVSGIIDITTDPPLTVLTDVKIEQPVHTQPPATATVVVRSPQSLPTRVVPDEQVKTEVAVDVTAPVPDGPVVVGEIPQAGNGGIVVGPTVGNSNDTSAKPAAPAVTQPFIHAEVMPEFIGGQAALMKYLQRQLRYPSQALRNSIEGKVFISFTVNTDGTIQDVSVLKGLGYGTDEEAARVIRQMPAWKPGYQNQHAVPVRYTLPITFKYE
ncbi:energy transducer TonB [Hymenobacter sediminis]|uniref:energy transducer TonB n=1 Tax=Hymenobacter sediminis TaxID=2218621 RepID=UPI0013906A50|nr:energy transducer TonB [Hymenobacter sediminis]